MCAVELTKTSKLTISPPRCQRYDISKRPVNVLMELLEANLPEEYSCHTEEIARQDLMKPFGKTLKADRASPETAVVYRLNNGFEIQLLGNNKKGFNKIYYRLRTKKGENGLELSESDYPDVWEDTRTIMPC